ncbi:MAG: polyketide cyclase [Paenibacillus sp.]|jgi:uncharacterized protein YndB with AHSA1/START domain|nr:polyketide cyclase [Paenibacillus sp.]
METLTDIRRTFTMKADIHKVWDRVATAEGLASWFMPPNAFEPVVGFEFHLNAGPWGNPACKVTEVDAPHRLSFLWGEDWTLTFELVDQGGSTEFTLIHSGWKADMETPFGESHAVVRERMDQGWAGLGQKLVSLVEA